MLKFLFCVLIQFQTNLRSNSVCCFMWCSMLCISCTLDWLCVYPHMQVKRDLFLVLVLLCFMHFESNLCISPFWFVSVDLHTVPRGPYHPKSLSSSLVNFSNFIISIIFLLFLIVYFYFQFWGYIDNDVSVYLVVILNRIVVNLHFFLYKQLRYQSQKTNTTLNLPYQFI